MFRLVLFIGLIIGSLVSVQAETPNNSISQWKKWAWQPLFNHSHNQEGGHAPTKPLPSVPNEERHRQFLRELVALMTNEVFGGNGESISQQENDQLLRRLVLEQLKAVDLLKVIQEYNQVELPELQALCKQSLEACDDGRAVLVAFLDVQNRIEEIENGRLDLRGLPEPQREVFASERFLCFYYDIHDDKFREKFKAEQIQSLRDFVQTPGVEQRREILDKGLVQTVFAYFDGSSANRDASLERPYYSESELTSITKDWDKRMIVAKCWRRDRVLDWKRGYLLQTMPEVLR